MDTPVSSVAGLPAPTIAPCFQQVDPVAVPETVNKMRLRRGYTLAQVSEYVGKQKNWASKIEKGKLPLRGTDLEAFASILDVPPSLLTIDLPSVDAEGLLFRKYRIPHRIVNMLSAEASIRLHIINTILRVANQASAPTFAQYNAHSNEEVLQIAQQIREKWGIPLDQPATSIAGYLEREGIILTQLPLEVEKINGATYWHDETTAPLIMLTSGTIDNIKRFILAHEYGHLVLDKHSPTPGNDPKHIETRADLFAGELLAPYQSVRPQFLSLQTGDLDGLMHLSRYWGLHPSSFVTRAAKYGDISKDQATRWSKRLSGSFRQLINNDPAPYPVRFTALQDIIGYLREHDWNLKSLLKVTGVSRRDLELVIGVDNSIIGAADGRPTLGIVR